MKQRFSNLVLVAIGLVSAGIVLAEVSLTRLFSVTIWYHYSFVAVSLAMLGMTASAVFVHRLRLKAGADAIERYLPLFAWGAGVLLVLGLTTYLAVDYRGTFMEESSSPLRLVPTLLFLPGFYLAGAVVCGLVVRHAREIDRLYFADLVAAGLGGALSVLALELVSGPLALVLAGGLFCLAGVVLAFSCPVTQMRRTLPILFIVFSVAVGAVSSLGGLTVRYTKDYDETRLEKVYEKWSALARITVIRSRWFMKETPYGWGLSSKYKGPPADEMWLEQDASAGSPIVGTDGDFSKLGFLDWDVTAAAYALGGYDDVAVIGLGGGRDALLALRHGARNVWGVEINSDIADLITDHFADFVGHVFDGPPVHVVVADGRTFMERTDERFDLIQISLIDSWAASSSGAYILAENNLYTLQAFETYLSRLKDDGVLTVSRWALTETPGEVIRLVVLGLEALNSLGVADPASHVAVIRGNLVGTVLFQKRPFTGEQTRKLLAHCEKMDFTPLYLPGASGGLKSVELVMQNAGKLDEFLPLLPYDFTAPTDDRPFFFLMLKPWDALFLAPFTWDTGLRQNFTAVKTLYVLFVILLLVVLLVVLVPARQLKKGQKLKSSPIASGVLFASLGLGFMLVEIPFIQKLVLILGHPIYSLSVVLTTLLVASGIGAAVSRKIIVADGSRRNRLVPYVLILCGLLTTFFLVTGLFSHELLQMSFALRLVLAVVFTGGAGFLMGLPFPSAVLVLEQQGDNRALPWLWAVNGASGVLGSVLAFAVALLAGFAATVALGALCYLVAAAAFGRLKNH
jgi:hypothetical protein